MWVVMSFIIHVSDKGRVYWTSAWCLEVTKQKHLTMTLWISLTNGWNKETCILTVNLLLKGPTNNSECIHWKPLIIWSSAGDIHHATYPDGSGYPLLASWSQSRLCKYNGGKYLDIRLTLNVQELLCKSKGFLQTTCLFFSSFSILLIAIDRYR